MKYKKFILKNYPGQQFPQDISCFSFVQAEIEEHQLQEGFALIQIYWISTDPLLRTWISGAKSYLDPVVPGSSIPGFGIAKIIKIVYRNNKRSEMQVGDWIVGMLEWSQYAIVDYKKVQKIPMDLGEKQYKFLSIYGPTGLTSYLSIKQEIIPFTIWNTKQNRIKKPEEINIVISSVAGGVGLTLTEYLIKLCYKNIYGIAGSQQKCQLAKELGCKDTINYKKYYQNGQLNVKKYEEGLKHMLKGQLADIYYQNVGEQMLSSMFKFMADHSKIIMCGATATYNNWGKKVGVLNYQNLITKRIQMKGILYFSGDISQKIIAFMQMLNLQVKGVQVIIKGIQKLPEVYRDMIDGKYIGKPLVEIFPFVSQ